MAWVNFSDRESDTLKEVEKIFAYLASFSLSSVLISGFCRPVVDGLPVRRR